MEKENITIEKEYFVDNCSICGKKLFALTEDQLNYQMKIHQMSNACMKAAEQNKKINQENNNIVLDQKV